MNNENLLENLLLFHQYLKKNVVLDKLINNMSKFPEFPKVYSEIRSNDGKIDTSEVVARTLFYGINENMLSESDLDELLFLVLEDSLFNSYLFKLDTTSNIHINSDGIETLLRNWKIPSENKILSNVHTKSTKDFIVCGYRIAEDQSVLESVRLLLLDSEILTFSSKNEEPKKAVYPTLVEIDFRRQLMHVRLRDVDNIVGASEDRGTMSGRISNTLKFISTFSPKVNFSDISGFKSSLYNLEEYLLSEKRNISYEKLEEIDMELEEFTKKVCDRFNPSPSLPISPKEYISTGVLSIIATTLDLNELGDVVGIKFRDTQNEEGKYAEITIKDSSNKCISTSNLYWLNLSVLQNTKEVEFLKIITQVPNGAAIVNLEFSLETANIKLLSRSNYEGSDGAKPSQEKYDDVLDFLIKFIN
ncbi:hypothetical protein [Psychrobacillus sp. BM2]|uniref:hypothetical protein n=1 Tax=Psychrobacillus sp. BM2 TaxID=3400421 RepID=UPI003B0145CF